MHHFSSLSDADVAAQIPMARKRAQRALRTTPHAKEKRFERTHRAFRVLLSNGAAFTVPVALISGLKSASDQDLAHVEVGPSGVGLRWERLDADLTSPISPRWLSGPTYCCVLPGPPVDRPAVEQRSTAARANGLKGGRPRKHLSKSAA